MKIEQIEDIISWQKAKQLVILIYDWLKNENDFAFKNQIQ